MLLEEWFDDRCLYHLVGFLIWGQLDVNDLRKIAAGSKKHEFKEALRAKCVERALGAAAPSGANDLLRAWVEDRVDSLEYPRDRVRIRAVLLLFNLATLLQHSNSNILFHFESFKTARWDIEHVRSVASDQPGSHPTHEVSRRGRLLLPSREQDAVPPVKSNESPWWLESHRVPDDRLQSARRNSNKETICKPLLFVCLRSDQSSLR